MWAGILAITFSAGMVLLVACGDSPDSIPKSPDQPPPDIQATIEASVQATIEASTVPDLSSAERVVSSPSDQNTPEYVYIEDLADAFRSNPIKAREAYSGKSVIIAGRVERLSTNTDGSASLELTELDAIYKGTPKAAAVQARCEINEADASEFVDVLTRQVIYIRATVDMGGQGYVFGQCTFEGIGVGPADLFFDGPAEELLEQIRAQSVQDPGGQAVRVTGSSDLFWFGDDIAGGIPGDDLKIWCIDREIRRLAIFENQDRLPKRLNVTAKGIAAKESLAGGFNVPGLLLYGCVIEDAQ